MAAPVDIPKSDSSYLSKSPVVSLGTYSKFKSEDSEGFPLQTPWTLWLDKYVIFLKSSIKDDLEQGRGDLMNNTDSRTTPSMSASDYEYHLKKVYTFNTIQGFWAVFNNVPSVEEIETRYSYHLMREERRPVWEEPYNQGGGAWRLRCYKKDTPKVWRELLLATIGEQLTDSLAEGDEIVGLTVSVRDKIDVLQIWNQHARLAGQSTLIAKVSRLLSDVDFQEPLYKPHQTHHAFNNSGR